MTSSSSERNLLASAAAHESWGRTANRAVRTAPARAALDRKFLDQAGGDPVRAESYRKAYFQRLSVKSVRARRVAAEARQLVPQLDTEAEAADAELRALGGDVA